MRHPSPSRSPLRALPGHRWRGDLGGLLVLLGVTVASSWNLLRGGPVLGLDTAAHFYPVYSFLGERLRAGDIPGWNPHQFAGVPFAADPESGWMYLPAMLFFTFLPLGKAAAVSIVFHFLLAGLAAYVLARVLGMSVAGALVAGVAYVSVGFLTERSACCLVHVQVAAWLPVLLIGAELAIRSRTWLNRTCWWGASGFALSQILAAWLGQGTVYALLALGGYVAHRLLLAPPLPAPFQVRFGATVLHLAAILVFGVALAAAGLLPRLEYNPYTNLAGGQYRGDMAWAAVIGGVTDNWDIAGRLLGQNGWYMGASTAVLALLALPLARARHAVPYFALLAVGAIILAAQETTPLHALLYRLLPRFEALHRHYPDRIFVVFYLAPALLAGATVHSLGRWSRQPIMLSLFAGVPLVATILLHTQGTGLATPILTAAIATSLLVAAVAFVPAVVARWLVPALLLLVVVVDLQAAGYDIVHRDPVERGRLFYEMDVDDYYEPRGAATFLRSQSGAEPFRFFGYDPSLMPAEAEFYRYRFADPRAMALLLNNRATMFGLHDVQGYNPIQLQRYVDYIKVLNGRPQEYHEANVYPTGLDSPMLDLLNARYLVIPAVIPPGRLDLERLVGQHPRVYADAQVQVLENQDALPRAWIVHEARQVATPAEALTALASGAVDGRTVALLEDSPPALAPAANPAADRAIVTAHEPDRLRIQTSTTTPGLLVLSEIAYPAWQAYVDGEPAPILTANALLRSVPIPAGEHTVELRFESAALRLGVAVSLIAFLALLGLLIAAGWRGIRRPPNDVRTERLIGMVAGFTL